MKKTIFVGLIIVVLATVVMASTSAYADKGGDPNNSEQSQDNAADRHEIKVQHQEDFNGNGNGPFQSHANTHDGVGVDCGTFQQSC